MDDSFSTCADMLAKACRNKKTYHVGIPTATSLIRRQTKPQANPLHKISSYGLCYGFKAFKVCSFGSGSTVDGLAYTAVGYMSLWFRLEKDDITRYLGHVTSSVARQPSISCLWWVVKAKVIFFGFSNRYFVANYDNSQSRCKGILDICPIPTATEDEPV